jgi:hypothetical protein
MGDPSYTSRTKGQRVPESVKQRVADLLLAGVIVADCAKQCAVSTYTVTKIAKERGIKYVRCTPGENFGKRASMATTTRTYEQDVRGWMHSLRWGEGHGA